MAINSTLKKLRIVLQCSISLECKVRTGSHGKISEQENDFKKLKRGII